MSPAVARRYALTLLALCGLLERLENATEGIALAGESLRDVARPNHE